MRTIDSLRDLQRLAIDLGVRHDWHEPDEQELAARVLGTSFDNAGFWPVDDPAVQYAEIYVVLTQDGEDVAAVNLATLFAWACRTLNE